MTSPFHAAFREELLEVARRDQRRRRRRIGALVAAFVAAVAGLGSTFLPTPAGAGVDIELVGGELEVRLEGDDVDAEEIVDSLREHGVDASVEEVPAGPSNVGRFVSIVATASLEPGRLELFGEAFGGFDGFRVRWERGDELALHVGRVAEDGETYGASTHAFAPKEPLYCSGILGRRVAEVVDDPVLDGLQVAVQWLGADGRASSLPLADVPSSPVADWFVVEGIGGSSREVRLQVAPERGEVEDPCSRR